MPSVGEAVDSENDSALVVELTEAAVDAAAVGELAVEWMVVAVEMSLADAGPAAAGNLEA